MSLSAFVGSYDRYVSSLSIFIDWISRKASECGYQGMKCESHEQNNHNQWNEKASGSRRNNHSRKSINYLPCSTREKEKRHAMGSKFNTQTRIISIGELTTMADLIVKCRNPIVKIPNSIVQSGIRAIVFLTNCRMLMPAFDPKAASRGSNKIENSIIANLLKEVIVKLQPCFIFYNDPNKVTDLSYEALEKLFHTHEIADSFARVCRTELRLDDNFPNERIAVEQDRLFSLYCTFLDFHHLLELIISIWKKYLAGEMDLITISVTTNVAFKIAIDRQEETHKIFSLGYENTLKKLIPGFSDNHFESIDIIDSEIASWFFCREFCILQEISSLPSPQVRVDNPTSLNEPFKSLPLLKNLPSSYLTSIAQFISVSNECRWMSKANIHHFAEDELTKALKGLRGGVKVPMWAPFAMKVFVEIDYLLQKRNIESFLQLRLISSQITEILIRNFEISSIIDSIPSASSAAKTCLVRMSRAVWEDNILEFQFKKKHIKNRESKEKYLLLKIHPILSGFMAFHLCSALQLYGVTLCNSTTELEFSMQLYTSLRCQKFPIRLWPLMERFIKLYLTELNYRNKVVLKREMGTIESLTADSYFEDNHHEPENRYRKSKSTDSYWKRNFFVSFEQIDALREVFPSSLIKEDGSQNMTESPNLDCFLIEKLLRIPVVEGLVPSNNGPIVEEKLIITHFFTDTKFLQNFSQFLCNSFEHLLFPYLTLKEQCYSLLLTICAEQIINQFVNTDLGLQDIRIGWPQNLFNMNHQVEEPTSTCNLHQTNLQPSPVVALINDRIETWAENEFTHPAWRGVNGSYSLITQEMWSHWQSGFTSAKIILSEVLGHGPKDCTMVKFKKTGEAHTFLFLRG